MTSIDQDDLRSEQGIDYTRLRNLLKAAEWLHADHETYQVMARAMGKKSIFFSYWGIADFKWF